MTEYIIESYYADTLRYYKDNVPRLLNYSFVSDRYGVILRNRVYEFFDPILDILYKIDIAGVSNHLQEDSDQDLQILLLMSIVADDCSIMLYCPKKYTKFSHQQKINTVYSFIDKYRYRLSKLGIFVSPSNTKFIELFDPVWSELRIN